LAPDGTTAGEFLVIDLKLQQLPVCIDGDEVAFLDKGNRTALIGFRR
jgi:hypothetical protein